MSEVDRYLSIPREYAEGLGGMSWSFPLPGLESYHGTFELANENLARFLDDRESPRLGLSLCGDAPDA